MPMYMHVHAFEALKLLKCIKIEGWGLSYLHVFPIKHPPIQQEIYIHLKTSGPGFKMMYNY